MDNIISNRDDIPKYMKQLTLKNSRKLKKNKEKINGLQIECLDNLPEIWRTRIRTHGD